MKTFNVTLTISGEFLSTSELLDAVDFFTLDFGAVELFVEDVKVTEAT